MNTQPSKEALPAVLQGLLDRFGDHLTLEASAQEPRWRVLADKKDAPHFIDYLISAHGATFSTLVGTDERALDRGYGLYQICNLGRLGYLSIECRLEPDHGGFPTLSPAVPAANWAEREVQDLLGLQPVGHPDPRRLILPDAWPQGHYPLRKDFDPALVPAILPGDLGLMRVSGPGVHEVPVGPIHAGIIEPGHFRFSVDGEHVIHLEARLFWKHRGMEKLTEGRSFADGLQVAERLCGACSFANALAYAQAVEALTGCVVPERARFIRVVACELERLYNHAGDVAGVLTDIAYATGAAQGLRLREQVLQLNEALAGHRLLMGLAAIGGVSRDLNAALARRLASELPMLKAGMATLMDILLHSESVLDRLETTGVVTPELARDLALVGPVARAAGVDVDVRRDRPYAAYEDLAFEVPTRSQGDVLSRVKIKAGEFAQSVGLINQALMLMPEGPLVGEVGPAAPGAWALGATESPRGENLHVVMAGPAGTVYRHKVRTSSYQNWPAVPLAALGNIVPDFPVINKSFNLCYACCDR